MATPPPPNIHAHPHWPKEKADSVFSAVKWRPFAHTPSPRPPPPPPQLKILDSPLTTYRLPPFRSSSVRKSCMLMRAPHKQAHRALSLLLILLDWNVVLWNMVPTSKRY